MSVQITLQQSTRLSTSTILSVFDRFIFTLLADFAYDPLTQKSRDLHRYPGEHTKLPVAKPNTFDEIMLCVFA
jgi:hypothetical protein